MQWHSAQADIIFAAMTLIRFALVALITLLAVPLPVAAATKKPAAAAQPKDATQATQSLGKFEGWSAYASQDKIGRVCYVVGEAQQRGPSGKAAMAMVTHRPTERITNVVSFVEGVPLREGSEVALDVGGTKFDLFTKDDSAWARTAELDRTIVGALAKGKQAVVRSQPQKGPATTDVYPLAGFPKALAAIDKACGVKRDGAVAKATARRHKPRAKTAAH